MFRLILILFTLLFTLPTFAAETRFAFCEFVPKDRFTQVYRPALDDPLLARALVLVGADVNAEIFDNGPALYYSGNAAMTRILLAAGADVNHLDEELRTPLFYAPDAGSVRLLIEAGADVNAEDVNYFTPIFYARNGDAVEAFLAAGARLTQPEGMTPLHRAWDVKSVELLIRAGVDPNAGTRVEGYPPLLTARNGRVVEALLKAGADPHFTMPDGHTLLFFAPDALATRLLLEAGVSVGVQTPEDTDNFSTAFSNTALFTAVYKDRRGYYGQTGGMSELGERLLPRDKDPGADRLEQVKLLIDAGEDVNVKNDYDYSMLMEAEDPRMVKLLLEHGADADYLHHRAGSALHKAECAESLRLLLAAGANVHAQTREGQTALFTAPDAESIRVLVAAGADVNHRDENGCTPLFFADSDKKVEALLDAGADIFAKNKHGQNVLITRRTARAQAFLIQKIREAGGDPKAMLNEWDKQGLTPLTVHIGQRWEPNYDEDFTLRTRGTCPFRQRGGYVTPEARNLYDALLVMLEAGADPNSARKDGRTIFFAARTGKTVKLLLEHGANPTYVDANGYAPIHMMMRQKATPEAIQAMLDAGVDPNAEGPRGMTPLTALASEGVDDSGGHNIPNIYTENPEITEILVAAGATAEAAGGWSEKLLDIYKTPRSIRALIEAGVDVNETFGYYNETALHRGNRDRDPEYTRVLLAAGADVNMKNEQGRTPIFCIYNTPETLKMLLAAGADVNVKDKNGRTALFNAAWWGTPKLLEILAAAGLDLDERDKNGESLLHHTRSPEIIRFLVKNGLDINAQDKKGNTPLHTLLYREGIRFPGPTDYDTYVIHSLRTLLECGADPNIINLDGSTPLHLTWGTDFRAAHALIQAGADVDIQDKDGNTPLLSGGGSLLVCLMLLDAGADVRAVNLAGRTVLHRAGLSSSAMLKIMIDRGADINAQDAHLKTPLHTWLAVDRVIQMFIDAGADLNLRDDQGKAPIDYFTPNGKMWQILRDAGAVPTVK